MAVFFVYLKNVMDGEISESVRPRETHSDEINIALQLESELAEDTGFINPWFKKGFTRLMIENENISFEEANLLLPQYENVQFSPDQQDDFMNRIKRIRRIYDVVIGNQSNALASNDLVRYNPGKYKDALAGNGYYYKLAEAMLYGEIIISDKAALRVCSQISNYLPILNKKRMIKAMNNMQRILHPELILTENLKENE